jgi:hypothetical protein
MAPDRMSDSTADIFNASIRQSGANSGQRSGQRSARLRTAVREGANSNVETPSSSRGFLDGRGWFRTSDLSRVKSGLLTPGIDEEPANEIKPGRLVRMGYRFIRG